MKRTPILLIALVAATGAATSCTKATTGTSEVAAMVTTTVDVSAGWATPTTLPLPQTFRVTTTPPVELMMEKPFRQDSGRGAPVDTAIEFVRALLNGDTNTLVALSDSSIQAGTLAWLDSLTGAPFAVDQIEAVTLAVSAGRTTIGVSVSFPPAADGSYIDPVSFLVETIDSANGTHVNELRVP